MRRYTGVCFILCLILIQYYMAEVYPQPGVTNSIGKVLPDDAAPLSYQVYRHMYPEPRTLDVSANIYEASGSLTLFDPLLKQNTNYELIPAAADRWHVSDDGTTWTAFGWSLERWTAGNCV